MRRFFKSFAWAGRGFATAVRHERNLRFHLCVGVYVYLLSLFYPFTAVHYVVLTLLVAGVLALELVNSAIERIVDHLAPKYNMQAGLIKDIAAAAVLVFCIGAAVCGFVLFWNLEVFAQIGRWFAARPLLIVLLAASLALCGWLVFGLGPKQKEGKDTEPYEQ